MAAWPLAGSKLDQRQALGLSAATPPTHIQIGCERSIRRGNGSHAPREEEPEQHCPEGG